MLRIGFDMDGVLADFAAAYRAVEARLYGPAAPTTRAENPEDEEREIRDEAKEEDPSQEARDAGQAVGDARQELADRRHESADRRRADRPRRRRDVVWQAIIDTPDFWTTLKPREEGAVRRIHEMMLRHRWEVFFITQRPATGGDTVQRQTQRWLVDQGFDLPSVLVVAGSRGAAAAALRLDYHVDDSAKNCIDVRSESGAKPLLIADSEDETTTTSARALGIGTAASVATALDILEQASLACSQPPLLRRLAKLVGWQ
jgi:hypothetical protein